MIMQALEYVQRVCCMMPLHQLSEEKGAKTNLLDRVLYLVCANSFQIHGTPQCRAILKSTFPAQPPVSVIHTPRFTGTNRPSTSWRLSEWHLASATSLSSAWYASNSISRATICSTLHNSLRQNSFDAAHKKTRSSFRRSGPNNLRRRTRLPGGFYRLVC
jgi:hypothetical protein